MRERPGRGPVFRGRPWAGHSVTLWLIGINAGVFLLQSVAPLPVQAGIARWLVLHPQDLVRGHVWELLTFQFLHGGFLHILMNCIGLYFFGRPLEQTLGGSRMLGLYLTCGVAGGLVQTSLSLLFPSHFGMGGVVGASAGVFGLVATFSMLNRETPITLLILVLPVTMRAKYLLVFEGILGVIGLLTASDNIAHGAHLGGMAAGIGYALYLQRRVARRPAGAGPSARISALEFMTAKRPGPPRPESSDPNITTEEYVAREVDPILEKISAHGIQSLTERERRILEAARHRIRRD